MAIDRHIQKLKAVKGITREAADTAKKLRDETKKHVATAVIAGFAFLIALVWKDFIQEYVDLLISKMQLAGPAPIARLITAITTTLICVFGIILINRWLKK